MERFFSEKLGDWVVDARCRCGRLQSEHEALEISKEILEPNHGGCPGCSQFTWIANVTEQEFIHQHAKKTA